MSMVAYRVGHAVDETPFRCVLCELLTKHGEDNIIPHMAAAHNMSESELSIDKDGNVFHTPVVEKDPGRYN